MSKVKFYYVFVGIFLMLIALSGQIGFMAGQGLKLSEMKIWICLGVLLWAVQMAINSEILKMVRSDGDGKNVLNGIGAGFVFAGEEMPLGVLKSVDGKVHGIITVSVGKLSGSGMEGYRYLRDGEDRIMADDEWLNLSWEEGGPWFVVAPDDKRIGTVYDEKNFRPMRRRILVEEKNSHPS